MSTVTQLLNELAVGAVKREDFIEWRSLLGFEIGWLKPSLNNPVCKKFELVADNCEIVLMQATSLTECHLHKRGAGTFMTLGPQHGFPAPDAGTLMAEYKENQTDYILDLLPATPGQTFEVPAGAIHAFRGSTNAPLTAVGFISPRIRKGQSFDIIPCTLRESDLGYIAQVVQSN